MTAGAARPEAVASAASNDNAQALSSRLRRLDAWAKDLGFPSTAAAKKWLLRHGITIYSPPGAVDFVDPGEAANYIMTTKSPSKPAPKRIPRRTDDEELDEAFAPKKK